MAPKRPTDGQPGPAAGAGLTRKGKVWQAWCRLGRLSLLRKAQGKAKAAARAEDSGSEDLVSDDDPPQAPVEDDGEGSDFDELQVGLWCRLRERPNLCSLGRWTLSSSTSRR